MSQQPHSWLQNLGIAIEVVCPTLAFIVTCLRIYIRLKTKNYGWDDTFIILSMVLSIALAVGSIFVMKLMYIGIHTYDVPLDADFTSGMLWIYVVGAVYNPILALVKQSILVFLLRLAGTKPLVRIVVWGTAIFNAAEMIAVFLVVIFQCSPIQANWELQLMAEGATCVDQAKFGMSTAILTIITDLIVLALPIYIFFDLKIGKRTKIALMVVFLMGFIVTIVSVVRLYFLNQRLTNTAGDDPDFSLGFCVSSIECNLAIITACGPAMWPLLRSWMPRVFSRLGISNGYQKNNNGDVEWTPNGDQKVRAGATNTIGGSSFALKDIREVRGDRARGRTDIHASVRADDSDEEGLTESGKGIVCRTDYAVFRDDESRRAASSRGQDSTV